jgi:SAM-dependent methyltransferase
MLNLIGAVERSHRSTSNPPKGRDRKANLVQTRGHLESVIFEEGALLLAGWVAAFDATPLDGFKLTCGGEELVIDDVETCLPSPDVEAESPSLHQAGACRFRIRAQFDREPTLPVRTSVFTLTPLFDGNRGRTLVHLNEPKFPAPSEEDVRFVGGGFMEVSSEFLGYFIQVAGLKPDSDVLDVGCGFGRMAYMLAHHLNPRARYEGFDIVDHLIEWAQRSISSNCPNFNFQKVDIYNKFYNPSGTLKSSNFLFPYKNDSFDLIFLSSVFTHMMPKDVRHYLDEIRRVLRPGGRCLSTCFLLNEESLPLVRDGKAAIPLVHPADECFVRNPEIPEDAIGFEESNMLKWIEDRDFVLKGTYYGSWCDRPKFTSFQDILVYQKRPGGWAGRKARDFIRGIRRLKSKIKRSP